MKINCYYLPILSALALSLSASVFAEPDEKEAKKLEKPKIEVCFVLDTTGSMGGLIQGAKDKIWSIANEIVSADPTPDLKIGLVAYRDRRDAYVTQKFALTDDIDSIYDDLLKFKAAGGGDAPESVNQALYEAVTDMEWSKSKDVLKIVFLVGDAPPHMDYDNDVQYPEVCQMAMKKDLIINTIQCGKNRSATPIWKEIATKSEGDYVAILQSGGTMAISTPFDGEIAKLNTKLNSTVCGYGSREVQLSVQTKVRNNAAAAPEAVASRVTYLSKQKDVDAFAAKQVSGDDDLIALIAEDKIKRDEIKTESLPENVAKMSKEERNAWIDKQLETRKSTQAELAALLKKRDAFVKEEKTKKAKDGRADGFDEQVEKTLRKQAARKGISYK